MDPAERIKKHMNADHQDSLVRFLEHFHGLSSYSARNAYMTDITLNSIHITTSPHSKPTKPKGPDLSHTYTIPLNPPMASWSDARLRMVELDGQSRAALGRDDVTLKQYIPPKGFHLVVATACALTYLALHRRANLSPATCPGIVRPLIDRFPGAAEFLWRAQPWVFWQMLAVHIGEAVLLDRTRLQKYNVSRGSGLWWKWVTGTVLEGFGNFQRIDEYVKQEKANKAKAKH